MPSMGSTTERGCFGRRRMDRDSVFLSHDSVIGMARSDYRERRVLSLDIGHGDEVAHTLEGCFMHADPPLPSGAAPRQRLQRRPRQ